MKTTTRIIFRNRMPILVFIVVSICLIFSSSTFANYSWKQRANYGGGGRKSPISFTINSKGYFGTGLTSAGANTKDFWEYDLTTNIWTQKADFGGAVRHGASSFALGGKGYAGLGTITYPVYSFVKDFWEFDPVANTWTQKGNFPGAARYQTISFTIGSKGYTGTGWDQTTPYYKDFWEYDPSSDTWTQKANFGGTARLSSVGFAINGKGYVGSGYDGAIKSDYWEYDPTGNTWIVRASFPGTARYGLVSFTLGSLAYVGSGENGATNFSDFYSFNATLNSWTAIAPIAAGSGSGGSFSIGVSGYVGLGSVTGSYTSNFYEYSPDTLHITTSQSNVSCLNGNNGTAAVTVTGGVSPYTYLWSSGQTTSSISGLTAGTYLCTVTDANGTSGLVSVTLTQPATSVTANISGNLSICSGSSTSLNAAATGGTGGIAGYLWSTGATTQSISVSTAATFTVTATDANGCTGTAQVTTTVNALPTCNISGGTSICQGGSTQLCTPAGLSSYSWSTGATTQCITVGSAGTYTVTITNSSGCTSTCNATVVVNNPPACSITGGTTICQGGSTQLCAPAGLASYSWSTGATTQCITVGSAGTYTVTITNASGCTSSCNVTVTVSTSGSCSITGSTSICQGGSTQLCAPAGQSSYSWNTGATTQCISVGSAGTYTATVTNSSGCTSTCNATVVVNNPPACSITGGTTICQGGSTQLCAPAGLASYSWSTGATTQCITVGSAGTYTVTITNASGCTSSCNVTVTVSTSGSCSITGSTSICQGGSTQLCAPAGQSSYSWSSGATTQCITVGSAGTYTATVTNSSGCTSTCSATVIVSTSPSCTISGNGSICGGGSTQLCAPAGLSSYSWSTGATTQCITVGSAGTYSVTVTNSAGCSSTCNKTVTTGGTGTCTITGNGSICGNTTTQLCAPAGAVSYAWSTGATSQCITVNAAGTYSVTTIDAGGCSSSCSKVVTTGSAGSCTISGCGNSICQGQSISMCAPYGFASYSWSNGATTRCINVSVAGTYTVTVTNSSGCTSSCSKTITVNANPTCSISGSGTICQGGSTQLCAPSGYSSYSWSNGSHSRCINVHSAGNYSVVVTNSSGCTSSCNKNVTVRSAPSCYISGNRVICNGQSTNLCAPSGYSSYHWSTGANTRCITVNSPGTYTVTVTNSYGCSSSCSACVTRSNHRDGDQTTQELNGILAKVFPNPFNSVATIQFSSSDVPTRATVEIFDMAGTKIALLFDGNLEANEIQEVTFSAENFAEGIYIYRITKGDEILNGRMILIKN